MAGAVGRADILCLLNCHSEDDEAVKKLFGDFDHALKNPGSLKDFVANSMTDDSPYLGVFLPGGHGAMLGLPDNPDVGKLLRWAHKRGLYTMAICHGPAALLAAKEEGHKSTERFSA